MTNRILTEKPAFFHEHSFNQVEQESLRLLAKSDSLADRKLCAKWLAEASTINQNKPIVLELADILILERCSTIRWGLVSYTLSPTLSNWECGELWPFAVKWGSVKNKSIRCAIGVSIVEASIGHDFDHYFGQSKDIINSGNRLFAYTVSCIYKTGQAKEKANSEAYDEYFKSRNFGFGKR